MGESQELPVIGGFGVTKAVGRVAGTRKTDFTCLITDVCQLPDLSLSVIMAL
jgi:hypothetical protein